jgi:ubiquinone/menaquinone biosynthesis C-methylase UbiE
MPLHALRISRRIEVNLIKQYLDVQSGDRLCDMGCGDGYWTQKVANGATVYGLDIDKAALTKAVHERRRKNIVYVYGSATVMPFGNGFFNKIYGICSMEHIPDNHAAFSEFCRCLKPGGTLVLTMDSLTHPSVTDEHRRLHHEKYFTPHLYSLDYARECLAKAGLKIVEHTFIISSPLSHALYRVFDRIPRLQYVTFPVSYPLIVLSDKLFGSSAYGWKLAIRAVKS